jgi:predicted DNA-binding ribbon-helix-helix protein
VRHRIIQHEGRRFSLKLDELVWNCLGELAARQGLRLNELVAQVAEQAGAEGNLTETLRLSALKDLQDRVHQLEQEVKELTLTTQGVPAALFAAACPAPCLLVGGDHLILDMNEAAQAWMGTGQTSLVGHRVDHYFQVRSVPPLAEILEQLKAGARKVFPARLVHVRPGRIVMARASLCPAIVNGTDNFAYFVIIAN